MPPLASKQINTLGFGNCAILMKALGWLWGCLCRGGTQSDKETPQRFVTPGASLFLHGEQGSAVLVLPLLVPGCKSSLCKQAGPTRGRKQPYPYGADEQEKD